MKMDLSDQSKVPSTKLSRKRKASAQRKALISSKRARFYQTYRRQNFSLPDSIIYYISMNPSTPKVYQKLIKTCKYFFIKNSIIVYPDAFVDGRKWQNYVNGEKKHSINLSKFTSKFWVIDEFAVYAWNNNYREVMPSLISKIYRFSAKKISITFQNFTFNEYIFLASSVEIVFLRSVMIKNENGFEIQLEKLVKTAAKANKFTFLSDTPLTNMTTKTLKNLFEAPAFSRLKLLKLENIPECFNLDDFYAYLKKNKSTKFDLWFHEAISDAYKNRIYAIIDEILVTETVNYVLPVIHFRGIDPKRGFALCYEKKSTIVLRD